MKDFNCPLFLATLILLLFFNRITLSCCSRSPCAVLLSTKGYHSLVLNDNDKLGNIAYEYISRDKKWNNGVGAYKDIAAHSEYPNCFLTLCSDVYLQGTCETLRGLRLNRWKTSPTSGFSSASCNCNRNCSCSDIQLKPNVCAQAYFNSDGCNACNSPYTELANSSLVFPKEWADKVESFLIRPGCNVTVYSDEDHEGDSNVVHGHFVQNRVGVIGSYECQCDSTKYNSIPAARSHASTSNSTTPMLQIPNTLDDVVSQMNQRNFSHKGLQAAFSSLIHGHSSKNAYILVLGSSGAGKSSVINNLLGRNVTLAGGQQSTTENILEFRIPVAVDKLGITNSELVIIDTPGLTDTKGVGTDALFLATLDDYLTGHAEFRNKIPNLVLVLHSFTDNRFHGDAAKFVNMIRALNSFRTKITDDQFSNVLFVFSHLCSEVKSLQRNPTPRLMQFHEVIEKYSLFPKPIQSTVIENHGAANELSMINGNYELPNKEHFPGNLLQLFNKITAKRSDIMGQAIVSTAFEKGFENVNITHHTFQSVNPTHSKVSAYLNILRGAVSSMGNSEVSVLLSNAFKNMSSSLKALDPLSLKYLQHYLSIRNFRTKADLPKTTVAILKLFDGMKKNSAIFYLMNTGLSLKLPEIRDFGVGKSYDIVKDRTLTESPILLERNHSYNPPTTGYQLPAYVAAQTKFKDDPMFAYMPVRSFDKKESYVNFLLDSFDINSVSINKTTLTKLTNKIIPSCYVKESTCSYRSAHECSFVGQIYYTIQTLELDVDNIRLSTAFKNRVMALPTFDETNHDNVNLWTNFFHQFGTHVVSIANIGGRIDVKLSSTSPFSDTVKDNVFLPVKFVDALSLLWKNKLNPQSIFPSGVSQSLTFSGGDPNFKTDDLTKLKLLDAHRLLKNWKHSVKFAPEAYPLKWIELSDVISVGMENGNILAKKVAHSMNLLFNGKLKFNPDALAARLLQEEKKRREEAAALTAKLLEEKKRRDEELRKLEEERQRKLKEQRDAERKQALEEQRRNEAAIRRRNELRRQLEEQRMREIEEKKEQERKHQEWLEEQRQYRLWQERQRQNLIDSMHVSSESDSESSEDIEEEDSPEFFHPVHHVGRVVVDAGEDVGRAVGRVAEGVGKGVVGAVNGIGKGVSSVWNSVFGG